MEGLHAVPFCGVIPNMFLDYLDCVTRRPTVPIVTGWYGANDSCLETNPISPHEISCTVLSLVAFITHGV